MTTTTTTTISGVSLMTRQGARAPEVFEIVLSSRRHRLPPAQAAQRHSSPGTGSRTGRSRSARTTSCSRCKGAGRPRHSSSRAGRPQTSRRCCASSRSSRRTAPRGSGAGGGAPDADAEAVTPARCGRAPGTARNGRRRRARTRSAASGTGAPRARALEGRGDHRAAGRAGHGGHHRAAPERRHHQLEHPRPDQLTGTGPVQAGRTPAKRSSSVTSTEPTRLWARRYSSTGWMSRSTSGGSPNQNGDVGIDLGGVRLERVGPHLGETAHVDGGRVRLGLGHAGQPLVVERRLQAELGELLVHGPEALTGPDRVVELGRGERRSRPPGSGSDHRRGRRPKRRSRAHGDGPDAGTRSGCRHR